MDGALTSVSPKDVDVNLENPTGKVRLGIIGIGQRSLSLLAELANYQNSISIVAVCDSAQPAILHAKACIPKIIGKFNYPQKEAETHTEKQVDTELKQQSQERDIQYFLNYKSMLTTVPLDWVIIGSKNCDHYDQCMAAFEANLNVFCEKPIAISIEQCLKLRNKWKQSQRKFITGFVLRHAQIYNRVLELIYPNVNILQPTSSNSKPEQSFGKIVNIEANEHLSPSHGGYIMRNWRRFKTEAGPHILEKCCHDIDILNMLTKSIPSKVAAFGGLDIFVPKTRELLDDDSVLNFSAWDSWEPDLDPFTSEKTIDDNLTAILHYRNNVKVTFNCVSSSAWSQRRMRINCLGGTIELDLSEGSLKWKKLFSGMSQESLPGGTHGDADPIMVKELCHIMAFGGQPKVSVDEGLISVVVCLAIEQARISGQVVDLEETWKKFSI